MSLHAHFQEALQFHEPPTGHAPGTVSPHTSGAIPFSRPASPGIMHDQLAFVGLGAIGHWAALNLARRLEEEGKVGCGFCVCVDVCWGADVFGRVAVVDRVEPRRRGSRVV